MKEIRPGLHEDYVPTPAGRFPGLWRYYDDRFRLVAELFRSLVDEAFVVRTVDRRPEPFGRTSVRHAVVGRFASREEALEVLLELLAGDQSTPVGNNVLTPPAAGHKF